MIFEFTLDENDFLTHLLFTNSKSEHIRKKRFRSRLAAPVVQFAFGLIFLFDQRFVPGIVFLALAPIWYFVYPIWDRKYHERYYKGFIKENMAALIGKKVSIELTNDFILAKDGGNEGKIATSEIQSIHEISSTIFIRLKGGKAFILPKAKIAELDVLKSTLNDLAVTLKIPYSIEESWEWK